MQERRATVKDVARASGVSTATVSFVLNDTPGQTIAPATRERVRAAAADLGYTPQRLARALREGRTRVVVLAIGELRGGNSLRSFVAGMRAELSAHQYALVVYPGVSTDAGHQEIVRSILPHSVLDLAELYTSGSELDDGGWIDGLAAHTLTQLGHLVESGRRRIAFAVPEEAVDDPVVARRWLLARHAARRLGVEEPTLLAVGVSPDDARAAVSNRAPGTEAVAAFEDETALRVLGAMADLDLRVPDDLAVIGFDAGDYGALWRPALTSVTVDAEAFGRRAARDVLGLPPDPAAPAIPGARVLVRATT